MGSEMCIRDSYYPVDSGVDFKYDDTGASLTTKRGAFFPYIDTNVTWTTSSGSVGTFTNGQSVSVDLGLSGTTFASEPTLEAYTLSGDSIAASGLGLDTTTGLLSGTVTADYIDSVMTKLTVWGSCYLILVCLMPQFLIVSANVPFYLGGTSLLIAVVVII